MTVNSRYIGKPDVLTKFTLERPSVCVCVSDVSLGRRWLCASVEVGTGWKARGRLLDRSLDCR